MEIGAFVFQTLTLARRRKKNPPATSLCAPFGYAACSFASSLMSPRGNPLSALNCFNLPLARAWLGHQARPRCFICNSDYFLTICLHLPHPCIFAHLFKRHAPAARALRFRSSPAPLSQPPACAGGVDPLTRHLQGASVMGTCSALLLPFTLAAVRATRSAAACLNLHVFDFLFSSGRERKSRKPQPTTAQHAVRGFGFAGARCFAVRTSPPPLAALAKISPPSQLPAGAGSGDPRNAAPSGCQHVEDMLHVKHIFSFLPALADPPRVAPGTPGGNNTPANDKNFPISSLMASILRRWGDTPMLAITRAHGKLHPRLLAQAGMTPALWRLPAARVQGVTL